MIDYEVHLVHISVCEVHVYSLRNLSLYVITVLYC